MEQERRKGNGKGSALSPLRRRVAQARTTTETVYSYLKVEV